ncbi:MAG: hypothetical protein Q7W29_08990 [bacterium]|nr:hypothetical protein [bacterium]
MLADSPNIELLIRASGMLGPILDKSLLVGGCAVPLLITDSAAPPSRRTFDVDLITDDSSYEEFRHTEALLRRLGFKQDMERPGPICRYNCGTLILDILPCNEEVLGFGIRWYQEAFSRSLVFRLPNGKNIRCASAPSFLATKLDAFRSRGAGDLFSSRDFEDIVALIDGRPELADEVALERMDLKTFIGEHIGAIMGMEHFLDSLPGMLPAGDATRARLEVILGRFNRIAV